MADQRTALRLALHAAGLDELLPASDMADDLFDSGLLTVDPENDAWFNLTIAGGDLIREALEER